MLNAINIDDGLNKKQIYELYTLDTKNNILKFHLIDLNMFDSNILKKLSENYIVKGAINNFSGKLLNVIIFFFSMRFYFILFFNRSIDFGRVFKRGILNSFF